MIKCITPCIYYREILNRSKKPSYKIICDYKEGEEIKNIPYEEKVNCKFFKSFKDIQREMSS